MEHTLPRCQPGRCRLRTSLSASFTAMVPRRVQISPNLANGGQRQFVADGQGRRRAPVGVLGWGRTMQYHFKGGVDEPTIWPTVAYHDCPVDRPNSGVLSGACGSMCCNTCVWHPAGMRERPVETPAASRNDQRLRIKARKMILPGWRLESTATLKPNVGGGGHDVGSDRDYRTSTAGRSGVPRGALKSSSPRSGRIKARKMTFGPDGA